VTVRLFVGIAVQHTEIVSRWRGLSTLNTVAEDWFPERGVDHGGQHSGIRSTKLQ